MKTLFKILFLLLSTIVWSQNDKNNAETLFQAIKCKEIVDNIFAKIEDDLKSQTKNIFENYNLDFNNNDDVYHYEKFLKEEIQALNEYTYKKLLNTYSSKYSNKEIENYINLEKDTNYKGSIIEDSKIKTEMNILVNECKEILSKDIKLTLERISAKYEPLKINIFINNILITDKNIDLELILNLKNSYKSYSYSILNENKNELNVPKDTNFDDIVSLKIIYEKKEYIFNRYRNNLPKEIQESLNPFSTKSFNEIKEWILEIDNKKITLKTNIEISIEK